jgi:hypothetical protein
LLKRSREVGKNVFLKNIVLEKFHAKYDRHKKGQ